VGVGLCRGFGFCLWWASAGFWLGGFVGGGGRAGLVAWVGGLRGMGAGVWWAGVRVCWRRRGRVVSSSVGRVGGGLVLVCVGLVGWVRKQSRVVWWLLGGVGWLVLAGFRLGWVVGSG
jgi:hypothetical protein